MRHLVYAYVGGFCAWMEGRVEGICVGGVGDFLMNVAREPERQVLAVLINAEEDYVAEKNM